jgi:hypothetical protein
VFNSGTEFIRNNCVFTFSLLFFALYRFLYLPFGDVYYGVSDVFMSVFQMDLDDYPQFFLAEDGRLRSTG